MDKCIDGRHLGSIWQPSGTSGRHLGSIWGAYGSIWEASGGHLGSIWEAGMAMVCQKGFGGKWLIFYCVCLSKVKRASVSSRRERSDPHQVPRLRTKVGRRFSATWHWPLSGPPEPLQPRAVWGTSCNCATCVLLARSAVAQ